VSTWAREKGDRPVLMTKFQSVNAQQIDQISAHAIRVSRGSQRSVIGQAGKSGPLDKRNRNFERACPAENQCSMPAAVYLMNLSNLFLHMLPPLLGATTFCYCWERRRG
jgi:hypothetical protein